MFAVAGGVVVAAAVALIVLHIRPALKVDGEVAVDGGWGQNMTCSTDCRQTCYVMPCSSALGNARCVNAACHCETGSCINEHGACVGYGCIALNVARLPFRPLSASNYDGRQVWKQEDGDSFLWYCGAAGRWVVTGRSPSASEEADCEDLAGLRSGLVPTSLQPCDSMRDGGADWDFWDKGDDRWRTFADRGMSWTCKRSC